MLKAMTHGQSSLTTVHAAPAVGALDKLALYLAPGGSPHSEVAQPVAPAIDFVVHLDRLGDGRRVLAELIEVAGFDGRRCTTNLIASRDEHGRPTTLRRLEQRHVRQLAAAGFDDALLAGGGSPW
jgi:pilus assembly protein CpaF